MLQKPGNNYDALSLDGTETSLGGTEEHQSYFHGKILDHFYERFVKNQDGNRWQTPDGAIDQFASTTACKATFESKYRQRVSAVFIFSTLTSYH